MSDDNRWWWFVVYRDHIDKTPHTPWLICRWCDGIANMTETDADLARRIRRYVKVRYIEEG